MLNKLKQLVFPQKAAGMEIILLGENRLDIRLVSLEFENNLLIIENKAELNDLEQLPTCLSTDIPLCIVMNGKGILHKKLPGTTTKENAVTLILPNANEPDFYIQEYKTEEFKFISIARRTIVDALLNLLKSKGYLISSLSFGGFSAESILPLLNSDLSSLTFSGHQLTLDRGRVVEYKFIASEDNTGTLLLDKEELENKYVMAYTAALCELLHGENSTGIDDDFITEQREEIKHKKIFNIAGIGTLSFFLIILIINFFLLDSYRKDIDRLSAEEMHYAGLLNKTNKIQAEVKEKEAFLSEAGWFNAARQSYYADRIASTVPSSIKLLSLSINPINEKESRAKKKIIFSSGTILLTGECSRATELNPWLQDLKKLREVYKAEIINYTFDKEKKGIFNIQLLVNG